MFRGRYTHTVDAKGRVAIPAKFRLQLDEGAVLASWMDGCAAIFTRDSFEALAAKVAALPLADDKARRLSRFLFSNAFDLETDAQGRVVLPVSIREWAGLGNEALVVGQRDHVEIWNPERWAEAQQPVGSPGDLASHLSGLVI
jgi:MraZ protein